MKKNIKIMLQIALIFTISLGFASTRVKANENEGFLPAEFFGLNSTEILPRAFIFNVPIYGTCGMNMNGYVAELQYAQVTSTYKLTGKKTYLPNHTIDDTGKWGLVIWHEDVQGNQIDFRFENIISEITYKMDMNATYCKW